MKQNFFVVVVEKNKTKLNFRDKVIKWISQGPTFHNKMLDSMITLAKNVKKCLFVISC